MPDPPKTRRQQLVDKLKARLAAITVTNGFNTNLGWNGGTEDAPKAIERWPVIYQEEELADAPRLGIFDLIETRVQTFPRQKSVEATLPVQVRGFVKRGESPDEMDLMIADVLKAIITEPATDDDAAFEDPTFGGLAIDTKPTEVGFIVPQETFEISGFAISFTVEHLIAPFSAFGG